jgi:biopolymer transport protein ExbB/TolQ
MTKTVALVLVLALFPMRLAGADTGAQQAERAVVMMEQVATVIDTHKDNCDAMGDALSAWMDKNAAELQRLKEAGAKLTAKQKQEFSDKYKDRMQAVGKKMMPALQKCGQNTKVTDAMKKAR